MDKKFLKENNLYEAHKQFMRLAEAVYLPEDLEEAEGEDPMGGNTPPPPADGADPMGGDPNAMGGDEIPPMDGDDEGEDPMGGNTPPPPADGADPMGGDPNAMGGDEIPPMDGGVPPMEDEDVIDVDDITNAQEKMNDKVNTVGKDLGKMDDKMQVLSQTIDKLMSMIDKNNAEIQSFKQEFEKRNPTQTEKLNLRSLDSYPFNVNPKDYWAEKGIDSNYNIYDSNDMAGTDPQSLEITNSDVDDFSDREIEDSFDVTDDMMQDLQKIFGL